AYLHPIEPYQGPSRAPGLLDRLRGRRLVHSRDGDDALGSHRLSRSPERARRQGHAGFKVKRQLVAFACGDELELQACRLGFGEHTRTFQEGEAWLAPGGESPQATDDFVVRALD